MSFKWVPGVGPSQAALQTMQDKIPRPEFAMGEAWFIGKEREIFYELMEKSTSELSDSYLEHILFELASGTKSFGHMKEWDEWFPYLLPRLNEKWSRPGCGIDLIEQLITTFICVYASDINGDLSIFRSEILATLPHWIMAEYFWTDWIDRFSGRKIKRCEFLESGFGRTWTAGKTDDSLSAGLVFCLRYLKVEEIGSWVKSILAIEDQYWRTALIAWISGVADFIEEEAVTYAMLEKASSKMAWSNSSILQPKPSANTVDNLMPLENRKRFLNELRDNLNEEVYLTWVDSISTEPELVSVMSYHLDFFFERFVAA